MMVGPVYVLEALSKVLPSPEKVNPPSMAASPAIVLCTNGWLMVMEKPLLSMVELLLRTLAVKPALLGIKARDAKARMVPPLRFNMPAPDAPWMICRTARVPPFKSNRPNDG